MIGKFFVVSTVVLSASVSLAQGPGDGGNGRGGGGGRGGPLTPEAMAQRLARTEEFLKTLDTNGNGMIDAEEANNDRAKFIMGRIFARMGREPKYPLAISEIKQAMMTQLQARGNGNGPPPGSTPPQAAPSDSIKSPPGMAFGDRPAGQPTMPGPSGSAGSGMTPGPSTLPPPVNPQAAATPAGAAADPSLDAKIRSLAAAILQKYDKNGDARLDRDEWPSQGKWGTFNEVNRSGANSVGLQEIVAHLTDYVHRRLLTPESLDSSLADSTKTLRKSGRFLTPRERLPKGLPEWFVQKDVDGDGQVSMAEFSAKWTQATLAEFARYDLNHDGFITASECLKVEKRAGSK